MNTFNLFFALLLLARNKKGTHGRVFFVGHLKRSFAYCSLVMVVEMILLNEPYNYRTYFHFETLGVLIINLFEKVLLFFMLFDNYSMKEWTDNKLKSKYIHIKGI
jgi:hypothetical protein